MKLIEIKVLVWDLLIWFIIIPYYFLNFPIIKKPIFFIIDLSGDHKLDHLKYVVKNGIS